MSSPAADLEVLVLCADWCSQCRAFRAVADELQGLPLRWIDIEAHDLDAEALGITAFPSVAVLQPAGVLRYLGPIRGDREGFVHALERLQRLDPRPLPDELRPLIDR